MQELIELVNFYLTNRDPDGLVEELRMQQLRLRRFLLMDLKELRSVAERHAWLLSERDVRMLNRYLPVFVYTGMSELGYRDWMAGFELCTDPVKFVLMYPDDWGDPVILDALKQKFPNESVVYLKQLVEYKTQRRFSDELVDFVDNRAKRANLWETIFKMKNGDALSAIGIWAELWGVRMNLMPQAIYIRLRTKSLSD